MNKSEALDKINYSFKNEKAQVITPNGKIYEEHIANLRNNLLGSVIEPVQVHVTSTCAKEGEFDLYKNSVVWAIAKNDGNWLLTLEDKREFALGFGSAADNIMMHVFSSSDVLGEWCA
jgi:hypothetical protein